MKAAVLLAALVPIAQATCAANNCLRALRAKRVSRPIEHDCSSFMKATVTPGTSTIWDNSTTATTTTTTTSTTTSSFVFVYTTSTSMSEDIERRDVTVLPTNIPRYASACRHPSAFSSACSCLGYGATTTTVATPLTTTSTSTTTVSTSTSVEVAATATVTLNDFALQIVGSPEDGKYLHLDEITMYLLVPSFDSSTRLVLDPDTSFIRYPPLDASLFQFPLFDTGAGASDSYASPDNLWNLPILFNNDVIDAVEELYGIFNDLVPSCDGSDGFLRCSHPFNATDFRSQFMWCNITDGSDSLSLISLTVPGDPNCNEDVLLRIIP